MRMTRGVAANFCRAQRARRRQRRGRVGGVLVVRGMYYELVARRVGRALAKPTDVETQLMGIASLHPSYGRHWRQNRLRATLESQIVRLICSPGASILGKPSIP
jgi:hypothetical protein